MKFFSANLILTSSLPPIKNGVVVVDDDGTVIEIKSQKPKVKSQEVQYFDGIIVPGFVNTHCHLELSHMKGQMSEGKGMAGFISELVPKRNSFSEIEIAKAIQDAENEMINNGIVAVGDISNTNHTFEQKAKQNLFYHTFIELFDLDSVKAEEVFTNGKKLQTLNFKLLTSVVPHAPYSVSEKLFSLINNLQQEILCIHNQESRAEDDLFKSMNGELFDLFSKLGLNLKWIKPGKTSIHYSLLQMLKSKRIQLVHNTFTSAEDISWANQQSATCNTQLFWCTCPNANLYIENKLPDYNLFLNEKVTIGTDSYTSNWTLSILDEMKTIQKHFPDIPLIKLIEWGTKNGAEFLGIEKTFGTIEVGKKPGLNLIENLNLNSLALTEKSSVRKLI